MTPLRPARPVRSGASASRRVHPEPAGTRGFWEQRWERRTFCRGSSALLRPRCPAAAAQRVQRPRPRTRPRSRVLPASGRLRAPQHSDAGGSGWAGASSALCGRHPGHLASGTASSRRREEQTRRRGRRPGPPECDGPSPELGAGGLARHQQGGQGRRLSKPRSAENCNPVLARLWSRVPSVLSGGRQVIHFQKHQRRAVLSGSQRVCNLLETRMNPPCTTESQALGHLTSWFFLPPLFRGLVFTGFAPSMRHGTEVPRHLREGHLFQSGYFLPYRGTADVRARP